MRTALVRGKSFCNPGAIRSPALNPTQNPERIPMKNHFDIRTSSIDAKAINETIQRALTSAGLETASGPLHRFTKERST